MLPQKNGPSLQSPLRLLSVLVFHLLLTHSCRGQFQLFGPSQPIVANVGDDIIMPCYLKPVKDVSAMTLEWMRPDLNPEFVNVQRNGEDLISARNPSFKGRTSLFTGELKKGNMSLKLSKVKPSDAGRYTCFIPKLNKASVMELVVGAVSSPVINLAGIDINRAGAVLQCESSGWYPEPEVLWLDGEGKLLSAGPTETVRGPDDLYTVSSRVTVEKRHSNSFTCRVHQKDTNHTTETHMHILDDFFKAQSSSASAIIGLAVSLAVSLAVCILLFLLLFFFVSKQRRKNNKNKGSQGDETDNREKKNRTNRSGDQSVTESSLNPFKRLRDKQRRKEVESINKQKFKEEKRKKEDTEKTVETLQEEQWPKDASIFKDEHHSSASQSLTTRPVEVEVNEYYKYIRLRNTSTQGQELGGWKLRVQFENKETITYTFKKSFKLKAGKTVTMRSRFTRFFSSELMWEELKLWSDDNKLLQVTLFCESGIF
ncbi:butyrophilin subfamily 3 member A2-like [Centropristis striata]|uniref:butyrophilin subfamily 3 member A2-like n=1 Tax=Centropristis striata TaxID=184440 RepID=UPI0027E1D94E|nr:butyrophilin subfamily 3 member A2-like [Centropristis striata]